MLHDFHLTSMEIIIYSVIGLYCLVTYLICLGIFTSLEKSASWFDYIMVLLAPISVPVGFGSFLEESLNFQSKRCGCRHEFEQIQRELIAAQSEWLKELLTQKPLGPQTAWTIDFSKSNESTDKPGRSAGADQRAAKPKRKARK